MVFIDKNSYVLVFKGFTISEIGRGVITEISLDDRYSEITGKSQNSDSEIKFIEKINTYISEIDKMVEATFKQQYLFHEQQ